MVGDYARRFANSPITSGGQDRLILRPIRLVAGRVWGTGIRSGARRLWELTATTIRSVWGRVRRRAIPGHFAVKDFSTAQAVIASAVVVLMARMRIACAAPNLRVGFRVGGSGFISRLYGNFRGRYVRCAVAGDASLRCWSGGVIILASHAAMPD